MQLIYLYIDSYKNIQNQGFNFTTQFKCEYKDGTLTIDKNENYILHPNNEFSFSKYKNINRILKDDFTDGLNTQGIYSYSLENILKNNEQAVMILKTKKNYQKELFSEKFNTAIIVLFLTVALSLLMALFVSKTPTKLQSEMTELLKAEETSKKDIEQQSPPQWL
jgi:hypothetical protein